MCKEEPSDRAWQPFWAIPKNEKGAYHGLKKGPLLQQRECLFSVTFTEAVVPVKRTGLKGAFPRERHEHNWAE